MNFVRAISTEGFGRIKYYSTVRRLLDEDAQFRSYFEGDTTDLPSFYENIVKSDLGPALWSQLPDGALAHDHHAYLNKTEGSDLADEQKLPLLGDVDLNPETAASPPQPSSPG